MYPFDYDDMPMTTDISKKVRKYEDIIQHNISVLWWSKKDGITPFYYTDSNYDKSIILMLCHNQDTEQNHFVYVPDLSRLLSQTLNNNTKHKRHFCLRCLGNFNSQKTLDNHIQLCKNNEINKVVMSDKDNLKFEHYEKGLKLPFVFYCDFECLICDPEKHKQEDHICHHYPSGAKYICISTFDDKPIHSFLNRGKNCVRLMLDSLKEHCQSLYKEYFENPVPIDPLTEEQEKEFYSTHNTCHICGKTNFVHTTGHPLSRVKDHCHFTGKYRGVAHSSCNLKFKVSKRFPVIFHNLKGYDSHFIIKELNMDDAHKINCIPLNNEKFISFSLNYYCKSPLYEIRFIDSFSFLSSSLEKLSDNLTITDFKQLLFYTKDKCNWASPVQQFLLFHLIKQKGFYPYEYMDGWNKFDETCLPSVEQFISKLRYETKLFCDLSQKDQKSLVNDYKHAQVVFKEFKCKNLGDYHDLYLETDVYLLADVFEKFRNISMEKFNLDPCHYYTLPGLAFDACLKNTGINLELFTEEKRDMYFMMENAKIGGISGTCGKRYAKANNKYLSDYNPSKPSSFINYNDANGLYSKAQSMPLPYGDFKYTTKNIDIQNISLNDKTGYFFMVDASIPDELHEFFNDYCPFPENISVPTSDYSPYQKQVWEETCKRLNSSCPPDKKLIPNLLPKTNYLIHGVLLKLFVELGCKIDKIHFVIQFSQSTWNKSFIDLCMNERIKSTSPFEKDFWKLICNAVYGKWLENVRNHVKSEIITSSKKFDKRIQSNTFKKSTALNDNGLVLVERSHPTITLNKPIYVGIAILQLSKYVMYDFFYNVLRKKYPDASLLYTDTDSFIHQVFTNDFYKDLIDDPEFRSYFDLSNYSSDHFIFNGIDETKVNHLIKCNKGILGKFKDEFAGNVPSELVGIRSKMYSIIDDTLSQKNTGKGIKKVILKKLEHKKYKDCLFHDFDTDKMIQSSKMTFIHSKNHNVYTHTTPKITLSNFDDKKYICDDGITQLSWGHYKLKK